MQVLATIAPLDPATGSRVTLRASSADRREMLALNSVRWVPAIIRRPSISDELFDGNFTGAINDGGATIDLAMFGLKRQDSLAAKYRYAGAAVTIYHGEIGDAWPWDVAFTGIVDTFTNDAERLSLRLKVNTAPFGVPALTSTYAGTGGKEGGADLKFKVKPWCFGAASNVQPVLIDVTNSVYQVSAYGPINGVTACYERGASFGASYGNYTTYANLVAASIPPGRWATCLAEGMIRLGAPETGLITADVEGDKPSTFLRKTGEIIDRICTNAGIASGSIDSTSLNGLDTALTTLLTGDGYINLYLTEQTTVMEIAQRLARPCNAAAGVHPRTGKLYVCRTAAIGTSVLSLNAQGRKIPSEPGVLACVEQDVSPPYWRIEMQGQRSWRVHSASEIAFTADLVEVGDYAGGTTYREGNISVNQGARWLYINPVASAGNAPPTLPTTSNSYWSLLSYPPDYSVIAGTKPPADATNHRTFRQPTYPTGAKDGDLWFRSSYSNIAFRFESIGAITIEYTGVSITYAGIALEYPTGSWVEVRDAVILDTQRRASVKSGMVAQGLARDTDVINFSPPLDRVPTILFGGGGIGVPSGDNRVVAADGLSPSGFTMRAVYQTVTAASVVTDTGASAGGVDEPELTINRTNGAAPFDGRFSFVYAVYVPPPRDLAPGEPGEPGAIEVGIFIKRAGGWIQAGSALHTTTGTKTTVATPGSVDFGAGAEFGISIISSDGVASLTGFTSVSYSIGTSSDTTLTPTNSSPIEWSAWV